eukprot:4790466-Pyramimonas_sp.AAC.1
MSQAICPTLLQTMRMSRAIEQLFINKCEDVSGDLANSMKTCENVSGDFANSTANYEDISSDWANASMKCED